MQGYLQKRSKVWRIWKKRFFYLEYDLHNKQPYLRYSKRSETPFKHEYHVSKLEIRASHPHLEHKNGFIVTVDEEMIFLRAGSKLERNLWIESVQGMLQRYARESIIDLPEELHKIPRKFSFFNFVRQGNSSSKANISSNGDFKEDYDHNSRIRMWFDRLLMQKKGIAQYDKTEKTDYAVWKDDVFPHWKKIDPKTLESLVWKGIPKEIRGHAWSLLLGNQLQITLQLYEICLERSEIATNENLLGNTKYSSKEKFMSLIAQDMPRTFGKHSFFQENAIGTLRLKQVLKAYAFYRPDLGYVQGMSYLAASLVFHMDSYHAFKSLANLLNSKLLFDLYRLEEDSRVKQHLNLFDYLFEQKLPILKKHFVSEELQTNMFLIDWALSLFCRCMSLDIVYRIWDCLMFFGSSFFYSVSLGVIKLYEKDLLTLDLAEMMKFLHNLPKSLVIEDLLKEIKSLSLSCKDIENLLEQQESSTRLSILQDKSEMSVNYPDSYFMESSR